MPVWTEVLALNAVDPDSPGMPVKYTVVDGDGINSFTIDSEGISIRQTSSRIELQKIYLIHSITLFNFLFSESFLLHYP